MNQVFPYTSHRPHRRLRAAAHPGRASLTEPDDWSKRRNGWPSSSPGSATPALGRYVLADLLNPQRWWRAHDPVVEIITVQALPGPPRHKAITNISRMVAPGCPALMVADGFAADLPDVTIVVWEGA